MHCGLQVELCEAKAWLSSLSWAHEDIYMGRLFAATPVLGQRSSWSCCSIGMGLSYCSKLAFWFTLLTLLPIQTGTARCLFLPEGAM
ncbi:Protein-tyrosine kinase 2-beta, partial [Dissostichus eleginoides]